jgi:hypothetical protein
VEHGISSIRRDVNETCALLWFYAAWSGNSVPPFWDNISVPSSRAMKSFFLNFLNLKGGTDRLPENVGMGFTTILCVKSQKSGDPLDHCSYSWKSEVAMRNCQIRPLKTQAALELLLVAEDTVRVSTHLFVHASLKPLQLSFYVTFQYRGTVFVITDGRGRSSVLSSRNLKRNMCPRTSTKIICLSTLVTKKVLRWDKKLNDKIRQLHVM